MLLKNKSIIISLILALIIGGATYYYFAIYNSVRDVFVASTYKGFPTAPSLFSGADLVVIGTPIKDFKDRKLHLWKLPNGGIMDIATYTELKVEKVLKGPKEDAVDLTVFEPIGVYQTFEGKRRMAYEGYTEMKKDSKYLIFLGKNAYGQYSVINMQAGKFNLDGTDPDDTKGSSIKSGIFADLKSKYSQELFTQSF
ncbi:hypothetical protein [Paenibacillus aquistagni]|uniref:hypothetical protein n=1 Tax=Paenibacillus aquistagni TaxID=1852522 RepID=UPI000B4FF863|nr:hypothetical protein [Paenibacillus aquistagni]